MGGYDGKVERGSLRLLSWDSWVEFWEGFWGGDFNCFKGFDDGTMCRGKCCGDEFDLVGFESSDIVIEDEDEDSSV